MVGRRVETREQREYREAYAGHVAQVLIFLLQMERSAPGTLWAARTIEEVVQSFGALTGIDLDEARKKLL